MQYTIKELAEKLDLEFAGDGEIVIDHVSGIDQLTAGGLAFITNPAELKNLPTPKGVFDSRPKELGDIKSRSDCAIIVPHNLRGDQRNLIFSDDPIIDHIKATRLLYEERKQNYQVHEKAWIGEGVKLGKNVTIEPLVAIHENVSIGDDTWIRSGSVIMEKNVIGSNCMIFPNVSIRENCQIGDRVVIHSGAVIGADGYGFLQRENINIKIPQIGGVIIEDDVEIGACTTIDRARFYNTIIGKGCKLDNLIHIAHNVELGEHSLITAQSGIAGSTATGDHLIMGGQSGIRDNLKIGNRVTLLARTLITSKTDDNSTVAGMPSRPIKVWRQIQALINNLDGLFARMKEVEQAVKDLMRKQ